MCRYVCMCVCVDLRLTNKELYPDWEKLGPLLYDVIESMISCRAL